MLTQRHHTLWNAHSCPKLSKLKITLEAEESANRLADSQHLNHAVEQTANFQ